MLHAMNEESRQLIRETMSQKGISQERLAALINERRKDSTDSRRKPGVTRTAVNRAINHAGELPPILVDILDELGLEVTVRPKP